MLKAQVPPGGRTSRRLASKRSGWGCREECAPFAGVVGRRLTEAAPVEMSNSIELFPEVVTGQMARDEIVGR